MSQQRSEKAWARRQEAMTDGAELARWLRGYEYLLLLYRTTQVQVPSTHMKPQKHQLTPTLGGPGAYF